VHTNDAVLSFNDTGDSDLVDTHVHAVHALPYYSNSILAFATDKLGSRELCGRTNACRKYSKF
jgi:hypothetical protein